MEMAHNRIQFIHPNECRDDAGMPNYQLIATTKQMTSTLSYFGENLESNHIAQT